MPRRAAIRAKGIIPGKGSRSNSARHDLALVRDDGDHDNDVPLLMKNGKMMEKNGEIVHFRHTFFSGGEGVLLCQR
ncbi:MAG: hypothetical protein H0U23_09790 [Blastocatellia bacterium]|nr:hypothetical protein [Blastocatellia bacterium]